MRELAGYDGRGAGDPIVLLPAIAIHRRLNWQLAGWYKALEHAGWRVIAVDARGHGQSDKPSDAAA